MWGNALRFIVGKLFGTSTQVTKSVVITVDMRNSVDVWLVLNNTLVTEINDGITGPREAGKIGFASLRAGGVIGEHTVLFGSDDELLTLSHSAIDRSLFAKGAVAAAAWVRNRRPGLYDMQDVLGFRQA